MKHRYLKELTDGLMDTDRIKAFRRAIQNKVGHGDVVVDCGTGTGILAIMASRAGARFVTAIDKDAHACDMAKNNVARCDADVLVVHGDAADHQGQSDVVIMDLFDTMLISGDLARVANSFRKSKTIPVRVSNFFELVTCDFEFYGCNLPIVMQAGERCVNILSGAVLYDEVKLPGKVTPHCVYEGKCLIHTKGWLNAIKFSTVVHLTEDIIMGATPSGQPICVPVEDMLVRPGEIISVRVEYQMGGGFDSLSVSVR